MIWPDKACLQAFGEVDNAVFVCASHIALALEPGGIVIFIIDDRRRDVEVVSRLIPVNSWWVRLGPENKKVRDLRRFCLLGASYGCYASAKAQVATYRINRLLWRAGKTCANRGLFWSAGGQRVDERAEPFLKQSKSPGNRCAWARFPGLRGGRDGEFESSPASPPERHRHRKAGGLPRNRLLSRICYGSRFRLFRSSSTSLMP